MSVMEISHRSKTFEDILRARIETSARWQASANYKVLMLQGGASLQFSMVPMNLLGAGQTARLHRHRVVGRQGDQGSASKVGNGQRHRDRPRRTTTTAFPAQRELKLTPGAAYVHITTNNTIEGTEWKSLPDVGDAPLVATPRRTSSAGPIDVEPVRPRSTPARRRTSDRPASRSSSSARTCSPRSTGRAADDAELQGAGREQLALQHAAHLRHLHPRPDDEVAAVARRPARRSPRSTSGRRRSSTPRSIAPASIVARRRRTAGR